MFFTDSSLVDELQMELADINAGIAEMQARQIVILNQLERAGVPGRSGSRTMAEWTAVNLDISPGTAGELVGAANRLPRDPWLLDELAAGRLTLERAMATVRLAAAEPPASAVDKSFDLDLAAVSHLTRKYRRMTRTTSGGSSWTAILSSSHPWMVALADVG